MTNIGAMMTEIGQNARAASDVLRMASAERKYAALIGAAEAIWRTRDEILAANEKDMASGEGKGLSPAMLDRLMLDEDRLRGIVDSVRAIADMRDPIGEVIAEWTMPSGLNIERVRTPIGVIGIIYESRPNVTVDAAALCLKSGNAAILRGGSESFHSATALHAAFVDGAVKAGLPATVAQMIPTRDREAVTELLQLTDYVDVIVPRGGKGLVGLVQKEARVPVFAHLEGIVHIYVDKDADPKIAEAVVINAKTRRTGICGAAECLVIDNAYREQHGDHLLQALHEKGVELRGSKAFQSLDYVNAANDDDFGKEFLDMVMAVKDVNGVDEAIDFIRSHHSQHTDSIITENAHTATKFFNGLDSAILMQNSSTQFADGGEFGMGAEIGIATGKLHARGPVGANELTSFKYIVRSNGATRS